MKNHVDLVKQKLSRHSITKFWCYELVTNACEQTKISWFHCLYIPLESSKNCFYLQISSKSTRVSTWTHWEVPMPCRERSWLTYASTLPAEQIRISMISTLTLSKSALILTAIFTMSKKSKMSYRRTTRKQMQRSSLGSCLVLSGEELQRIHKLPASRKWFPVANTQWKIMYQCLVYCRTLGGSYPWEIYARHLWKIPAHQKIWKSLHQSYRVNNPQLQWFLHETDHEHHWAQVNKFPGNLPKSWKKNKKLMICLTLNATLMNQLPPSSITPDINDEHFAFQHPPPSQATPTSGHCSMRQNPEMFIKNTCSSTWSTPTPRKNPCTSSSNRKPGYGNWTGHPWETTVWDNWWESTDVRWRTGCPSQSVWAARSASKGKHTSSWCIHKEFDHSPDNNEPKQHVQSKWHTQFQPVQNWEHQHQYHQEVIWH